MRLRLTRRRASVAVAAATIAVGSAAGYALALTLPVQLPGLELEIPIDLPDPLISPPQLELPSNPIIGPPDGDELAELTEILQPEPAPAAARPAPVPARVGPPVPLDGAAGLLPAIGSVEDVEDLTDDLVPLADLGPSDLLHLGTSAGAERNNNNVHVIYERGSDGNANTVRQRAQGGTIVTCVEGSGEGGGGCGG